MKGDEVVETLEERAYLALLGQSGEFQIYCGQLLTRNLKESGTGSLLLRALLYVIGHREEEIDVCFIADHNGLKTLICAGWPAENGSSAYASTACEKDGSFRWKHLR